MMIIDKTRSERHQWQGYEEEQVWWIAYVGNFDSVAKADPKCEIQLGEYRYTVLDK